MKRFLLSIAGIIAMPFMLCFSQNLVINPGFENYTSCPDDTCQISKAIGWYNVAGAPSYFNACGSNGFGVPNNIYGNQSPGSGNAYGLFNINVSYATHTENLGGELTNPLIPGNKYYVCFNASLADKSEMACKGIRMIFTKSKYFFSSIPYLPCNSWHEVHSYNRGIYSDSIVADSTNWTKISGSFIADSAYKYFTIGYFNVWDSIYCTGNFESAIYYIDDVCVSTDSLTCATVDINEINKRKNEITLYPSPASSFITVDLAVGAQNPMPTHNSHCKVYNILGTEVLSKSFSGNKFNLDVSGLSEGLYLLRVESDDGVAVKRFIKE